MDGLDVHAARDAAFGHVGTLGLVHDDRADHLGGQQIVADAAADQLILIEEIPVAAGDRMAIDGGLGEAGAGAPNGHAVILIEAALPAGGGGGVDAGQALDGIGHVLVRQLADVAGLDDFNVVHFLALGFERLRQGVADARDHHLLQRVIGLRGRRGCSRIRRGIREGDGDRRQQRHAEQPRSARSMVL
jgi:hypothetical protein